MKYKRSIALLLSLVLLMGCIGITPAQAAEETGKQPPQSQEVPAPEHVDHEQFAQEGHLQRLPDEERMDTYVYLNRDGTKSVYYMGRNVKYRDHNGQVRDKDTSLVRGERGYRMRDNDVELHLPDSPADGITLAYGTDSVKLLPQGGSGNASFADNSITYTGYFGPGTALRYTPLLEGVKEDIILSSYTGQNSFSFILETGGLYLYEAEGQYYLAENAESEAAFYLGQIVVYDAVGCPDDGSMAVETLVPGQKYRLTLSADLDFLTDPETVFPVTIDPTLTVGYAVQGVNSIVDAPLYQGYPNNNYGGNYYNYLGYYNDSYQTARTVMRPEALLSSDEWESIDSADITGLSLFVKDSSGRSSKQVNVHALTTNSTWTESSITWNNVGSYASQIYASANLGIGAWTEFDLTLLAKAWKDGLRNENCGFLLKMADETLCRGFLSGEYGATDYRPYMVLSYETAAYLNYTVKDLDEGDSFTLAAGARLGISGSVTWFSANASVASVTQGGVVTGHLAGSTTITASFTDNSGNDLYASCTVYVTVADGLYYIKNAASGLCMQAASSSNRMFAQNTNTASRHTQLWKIAHISNGNYVVRSLPDVSKALTISAAGQVTIGNAAVSDAGVTSGFLWQITHNSFGYAFKQGGLDANTMTPAVSTSNAMVYPRAWTSSLNCHWELEEAKGIFFRDNDTHQVVTSANVKYIGVGEKVGYAGLGLSLEYYGIDYSSSWTSSRTAVATVNALGTITALSTGHTIITHKAAVNGIVYSTAVTVRVNPIPNGTYYIRNWQTDMNVDVMNQTLASGNTIYEMPFDPTHYQQWVFTILEDGNYSIHISKNGTQYYLGVSGDSSAEAQPVVLRTGTITNGMKWAISTAESGAYIITPLTGLSNSRVLSVHEDYLDDDVENHGLYIQQRTYTADDDHVDEWLLAAVNSTIVLEPQKMDKWCWAACARMASMRYMTSMISQEAVAVNGKKSERHIAVDIENYSESEINQRNGSSGVCTALRYLTGSDPKDNAYSITHCSDFGFIFEEDVLKHLLDQGIPVIIGRLGINKDNPEGAHFTVIVGYEEDSTYGTLYEIYDPWDVNEGSIYYHSYEWLLYGQNQGFESEAMDYSAWFCVIAFGVKDDLSVVRNPYYPEEYWGTLQ